MVTEVATDWDLAPLFDLHVHPTLPWVGAGWRRWVQKFSLDAFAGKGYPSRIYGAVFYETYLLHPQLARNRLFCSLETFQNRIKFKPDQQLLLFRNDLIRDACPLSFFLAVESTRYLRDAGDIRLLWNLGVRSLQPIHFLDTPWGGSSREGILPQSRRGISGMGKEMLFEMNSMGMILDIAHMSERNAEESLALYRGPVMCSHTGFFPYKKSARNLTTELALEVFRRRGLVGITCWRHLLGPDPGPKGIGDQDRDAWTRSYCAAVAAFSALASECSSAHLSLKPETIPQKSLVAIGSDRGAPIRVPAWFYSPAHLGKMQACFLELGWTLEQFYDFIFGNGFDFLQRSLPA